MTQTLVRPPVVVVLGHVDHGKTTLLDHIRQTDQTAQEVGGITQAIGAYEVDTGLTGYNNSKITFIDTPGHEAFSRLRSRGAAAADLAVLIVDAVNSVMPQTVEALSHIKATQLSFVVAINKIDLPQANLERVKKDLTREGVMLEGVGGDVPAVGISAKTGAGVADLLEAILIMAEEKREQFSPQNPPQGVIIESQKDKDGVTVSVILKDGCLKVGDTVFAEGHQGKVKAIIGDRGQKYDRVCPSTPFILLGFKQLPKVGAVIGSQPTAKSAGRPDAQPKKTAAFLKSQLTQKPNRQKLKIILKTSTQGHLDSLKESIAKNDNLEIVLATVGEISRSDIFLAKVTKAIVIGFAVKPDKAVLSLAEAEKVVVKTYDLIYKLLEELTEVSSLLSEKEKTEKQLKGEAKILAQFIIEKERVAGVKVAKGKFAGDEMIEIFRGDKLIGRAKIASLKVRAKAVTEVKKNEEAGMIFYPQLDFAIGDVIKSYSI